MRIFQRHFALRIYRLEKDHEALIRELLPWVDSVLYSGSPFLRQVSSYLLRPLGGSYAPNIFKDLVSSEIIRLTENEDLRQIVLLSLIESIREHNPSKGTDFINYLSWKIPYKCSKLVTWRVFHSISPFKEEFYPEEYTEIEDMDVKSKTFDILTKDAGVSRQLKYFHSSTQEE